MTFREIMKYVESEYKVINETPCEVCGGEYMADEEELLIIDGDPYDICECVCSNCGHEKIFEFLAPFVEDKDFKKIKNTLN